MNQAQLVKYIEAEWERSIIPALMEYIKIPNKSPLFDPQWEKHGYMNRAVSLFTNWCQNYTVPNMRIQVVRLEKKTPVILVEFPGVDSKDTILLYGHLDKQPEMTGWYPGLGPWTPVLYENKLYGRGAADDGYAFFAAIMAIYTLAKHNIAHARCAILIEASEESGSPDLPLYITTLSPRFRDPSLVICLDSGCGNYNQLWLTTSLRGLISGILEINVLHQGVHSGTGSGTVPSCFRILRQLLNRIENESNGDIILEDLHVNIPEIRRQQAEEAANILGEDLFNDLPFEPDVLAESASKTDLILRRTWKPALSVIGCDGIPLIENAGNVTLPSLSVKLSMRVPPTCDAQKAIEKLKSILEDQPPYQAHVQFTPQETSQGWEAPPEEAWLTESLQRASKRYFGENPAYMGEGGTIPFMSMLSKKFPGSQYMVTGVLGPGSNAHGPNEFLHIPTAKKLTCCIAQVITDHFKRPK